MVGDHAEGHVDTLILRPLCRILHVLANLASVLAQPRHDGLDGLEEGGEDVDVVVGHLVEQDGRDTLEAHAGVDARRRQRGERAVSLAVELHEDVVPNLEDVRVGDAHGVALDDGPLGRDRLPVPADAAVVDEVRRVAPSDAVVVDLGAGAAPGGAQSSVSVTHAVAHLDGAHGPVSPISQKLSFMLPAGMRWGGTYFAQMARVSVSAGTPSASLPSKYVTYSRSGGMRYTSVSSCHAHAMASSLK